MTATEIRRATGEVLSGPAGQGVIAAYLFGSRAADRAHRESDVDIGVVFDFAVFPTSRDRFEAALMLHSALASQLEGAPLDLVVLNDAPPGLAVAVAAAGERLYIGDSEGEHAFRRDVQIRAADLLPFLKRTAAIKREAIRR